MSLTFSSKKLYAGFVGQIRISLGLKIQEKNSIAIHVYNDIRKGSAVGEKGKGC